MGHAPRFTPTAGRCSRQSASTLNELRGLGDRDDIEGDRRKYLPPPGGPGLGLEGWRRGDAERGHGPWRSILMVMKLGLATLSTLSQYANGTQLGLSSGKAMKGVSLRNAPQPPTQ